MHAKLQDRRLVKKGVCDLVDTYCKLGAQKENWLQWSEVAFALSVIACKILRQNIGSKRDTQ